MSNHVKHTYYLTTTLTVADEDHELRLSSHASLYMALWAMHDYTTPLTGKPVDVELWDGDRLIPREWAFRAMARVVGGEFSRHTQARIEAELRGSLPR